MPYPGVVGKIDHSIFKALIFWERVKVLLGFENVALNRVFKKSVLR
jgi:hypothetical protein